MSATDVVTLGLVVAMFASLGISVWGWQKDNGFVTVTAFLFCAFFGSLAVLTTFVTLRTLLIGLAVYVGVAVVLVGLEVLLTRRGRS